MPNKNERLPDIKGFDCPLMGQVSFEECLAHAELKRGVPECGFGFPTLNAMIFNLTRTDSALDALRAANPFTFRVTQLTNPCSRDVVLSSVQPVKYVTPQSSYYLARGQITHALRAAFEPALAQNAPRLSMTVELIAKVSAIGLVEVEAVVTGQEDATYFWQGADNSEIAQCDEGSAETTPGVAATLFDYKSTALLPYTAHPEHIAQVNLYNEARRRNGLPVADRLAIDYFSMVGERIFEVPLWPSSEVEAYMVAKLTPIVESLLSQPPTKDSDITNEYEADSADDLDSWLPPRLDPIADKVRGWKCRYCNHAALCWPEGVPGAEALAGAKQAASGAARRAYYANLNNVSSNKH